MLIRSNSTNVLYQTLVELEHSYDLSEEEMAVINEYLNNKQNPNSNKDSRKATGEDFKKIYQNHFYKKIKDNDIDDNVSYFLKNAGIYSYVDSYFNYLRKPEKYKSEVKRVAKLYYAAHSSIIKGIYDTIKDKLSPEIKQIYSGFYDSSISKNIDRAEFRNLIEKMQSLSVEQFGGDSYYSIINNAVNSKIEFQFITTNYTNFAEKIIKNSSNRISYIHGKLDLFEDLTNKQIAPVDELNSNHYIFPYVLVQSGIKPIISGNQIKEFAKAVEYIDNCDTLIIIGYGVNSDDEHISNLLRERVAKSKRIIYFIYSKNNDDYNKEQERIKNELFDENEIVKFYRTDEFAEIINNIKEEI